MRDTGTAAGLAGSELWQVRVFTGPQAMGNLTGVVTVGPHVPTDGMLACARLLGYPDTAFVRRDGGDVHVSSYSPYEPLRLCTQTLLATEHVLRARGELTQEAALTAGTQVGPVRVRRLDGRAYVVLTGERTQVRPARQPLPLPAVNAVVVNTGRARSYVEMALEVLESASPDPTTVLHYCAAEEVNGICLVAPLPDGSVRLRVFTTSLGGAEDAATGGAAGGLPAFLATTGRAAVPALVRQGHGTEHTRAELHVRPLDGDDVGVGGQVVAIATGRLDHQLPVSIS